MAIRGRTPAERREARMKRAAERRTAFYRGLMGKAQTARQLLAIATDLAKAVGDELDEKGRYDLALAVAKAAEERNPHRDGE